MTPELAALKALAEEAGGGPWQVAKNEWNTRNQPWTDGIQIEEADSPYEVPSLICAMYRGSHESAAFIAAANPARILSMIADTEALRERCGELEHEISMVQISDDAALVFVDGRGDAFLDWGDGRLKRAEAAESLLAEVEAKLARVVPLLEQVIQIRAGALPDLPKSITERANMMAHKVGEALFEIETPALIEKEKTL